MEARSAELKEIYFHYSSLDSVPNVEGLACKNFLRLLRDCDLMGNLLTLVDAEAIFKASCPMGWTSRMTYAGFEDALQAVAAKWKSSKLDSADPKAALTSPLQGLVEMLDTQVFPRNLLEGDTITFRDSEFFNSLLDPGVVHSLKTHALLLMEIFSMYSMRSSPDKAPVQPIGAQLLVDKSMTLSCFLDLARDLRIIPDMLSSSEVTDNFRRAVGHDDTSHDEKVGMSLSEFAEALCRCAFRYFRQEVHETLYPSPASKLETFFELVDVSLEKKLEDEEKGPEPEADELGDLSEREVSWNTGSLFGSQVGSMAASSRGGARSARSVSSYAASLIESDLESKSTFSQYQGGQGVPTAAASDLFGDAFNLNYDKCCHPLIQTIDDEAQLIGENLISPPAIPVVFHPVDVSDLILQCCLYMCEANDLLKNIPYTSADFEQCYKVVGMLDKFVVPLQKIQSYRTIWTSRTEKVLLRAMQAFEEARSFVEVFGKTGFVKSMMSFKSAYTAANSACSKLASTLQEMNQLLELKEKITWLGKSAEAEQKRASNSLPPMQPPACSSLLFGRDDLIKKATAAVTTGGGGKIINFYGPPGSGRTSVASKLGEAMRKRYPGGTLYVNMYNNEDCSPDSYELMSELLRGLDPSFEDAELPGTMEGLSDLYHSVVCTRQCVIILDNVAHPQDIIPVIPKYTCCLIATSVKTLGLDYAYGGTALELSDLSEKDAEKMVKKVSPHLASIAAKIGVVANGRPWPVQFLARSLDFRRDLVPEDVVNGLMHQWKRGSKTEPYHAVSSCITASLGFMKRDLMKFLVRLAIFPAAFDSAAANNLLSDEQGDEFKTAERLTELTQYGFLEFDPTRERYWMDTPLRRYLRPSLDNAEWAVQADKDAAIAEGVRKKKDDGKPARKGLYNSDLLLWLIKRYVKHYIGLFLTADKLYRTRGDECVFGFRLFDRERPNILQALIFVFNHEAHFRQEFQVIAETRALLRVRLSTARKLEFYRDLEEIFSEHKDKPNLATVQLELGHLYVLKGEFVKGEKILQKSLNNREDSSGFRSQELIPHLNNLAQAAMCIEGAEKRAVKNLLRSLNIVENSQEENYIGIAQVLTNMASYKLFKRRYEEAEPLYKQALVMVESILGESHYRVARSAMNLANTFLKQKKWKDAEVLLVTILRIWETNLGEEHFQLCKIINKLAMVYYNTDRAEESERLYTESLRIATLTKPDQAVSISKTIRNLAHTLLTQGKLEEAEEKFRESLDILLQQYGKNPLVTFKVDITPALSDLVTCLHRSGKNNQAKELYQYSVDSVLDSWVQGDGIRPNVSKAPNALLKLLRKQQEERGDNGK